MHRLLCSPTSGRAVEPLGLSISCLVSVQVHHHPCNWENPDAFIPVSASPAITISYLMAVGGCRMTCGMPALFMDGINLRLGLWVESLDYAVQVPRELQKRLNASPCVQERWAEPGAELVPEAGSATQGPASPQKDSSTAVEGEHRPKRFLPFSTGRKRPSVIPACCPQSMVLPFLCEARSSHFWSAITLTSRVLP